MTQHVAYRWNHELFCEDDIVPVLTQSFPWSAWIIAGNQASMDDAETELDTIAHMFGIDREAPRDVIEKNFPQYVGHHPGYCFVCHRWFRDE